MTTVQLTDKNYASETSIWLTDTIPSAILARRSVCTETVSIIFMEGIPVSNAEATVYPRIL